MKTILNKLFEHQNLSKEEAASVIVDIASDKVKSEHIVAFLTAYQYKEITVEELSGFRSALLELSDKIDLRGAETIDVCGTGGDGKNTFNISTLSAFVIAGAGIKVSKHGNYGVSSVSGSSNVLEQLSIKFTNDHDKLLHQLDKAGICFLHAPLFHPALKKVAPIRKELGFKTFFNILGPLVNPAQPKFQYTGVYSLDLGRLYSYLLQRSEVNYSIVHSLDNYDEVSLTSPFKIITQNREQVISPEDLEMKKIVAADLYGGSSVQDAADIFLNVLQNKASPEQKDVVLINSALAIQCVKSKLSIKEALETAKESLESGKALESFKILQSLN